MPGPGKISRWFGVQGPGGYRRTVPDPWEKKNRNWHFALLYLFKFKHGLQKLSLSRASFSEVPFFKNAIGGHGGPRHHCGALKLCTRFDTVTFAHFSLPENPKVTKKRKTAATRYDTF